MVHLYFFTNPLHKLGFLGRLFFRRSERLLKPADAGKSTPPPAKSRIPTTPFYDNEIRAATFSGEVFRDPDYYKDDSEGGFCVFRVENTLFKVIFPRFLFRFLAHCFDFLYRFIDVFCYGNPLRLSICSACHSLMRLKADRTTILLF